MTNIVKTVGTGGTATELTLAETDRLFATALTAGSDGYKDGQVSPSALMDGVSKGLVKRGQGAPAEALSEDGRYLTYWDTENSAIYAHAGEADSTWQLIARARLPASQVVVDTLTILTLGVIAPDSDLTTAPAGSIIGLSISTENDQTEIDVTLEFKLSATDGQALVGIAETAAFQIFNTASPTPENLGVMTGASVSYTADVDGNYYFTISGTVIDEFGGSWSALDGFSIGAWSPQQNMTLRYGRYNRVSTSAKDNTADIATLETSMTTAQADITSAEADIAAIDTRVGTAETDIDTAETNIATLTTDLDTAEAAIQLRALSADVLDSSETTITNGRAVQIGDTLIQHFFVDTTLTGSTSNNHTFPIAFSSAAVVVTVTPEYASGTRARVSLREVTATKAVTKDDLGTVGSSVRLHFSAVGPA